MAKERSVKSDDKFYSDEEAGNGSPINSSEDGKSSSSSEGDLTVVSVSMKDTRVCIQTVQTVVCL